MHHMKMMQCHPGGHHGFMGGYGCCCEQHGHGGMGGFHRKFYSKKEKLEWLNEYKEQLEQELQGLNEKIAKLEKI